MNNITHFKKLNLNSVCLELKTKKYKLINNQQEKTKNLKK